MVINLLYFQMKLCAGIARIKNRKFIKKKLLIFLHWKKNFLGFGLNANVAQEVSMKMYCVPGV